MPKRAPANVPVRFKGPDAKRNVLEAVKSQRLISKDETLARRVVQAGTVLFYERGDVLWSQDDQTNFLMLILSGQVSIRISGREVARRLAGNHIGEMSLVDFLARRSATVVALEPTATLRLSEPSFTSLANDYPDLWRRIAVEIASRLRERSSAIREPNNEPIIFIGSSSEALNVAREVHRQLERKPLVARIWNDGVFQASLTAMESLVKLAETTDLACLVLSNDDLTVSRGTSKPSPRDNVTFELGMLIGALGRERVFLLKPRKVDVRIPTDLLGVTCLEYAQKGPIPISARLRPACSAIWTRAKSLGPR